MSRAIAMCTCKEGTIAEEVGNLHKVYEPTKALEDGTCFYCGFYVQYRPVELEKKMLTDFYNWNTDYRMKTKEDGLSALDIFRERGD